MTVKFRIKDGRTYSGRYRVGVGATVQTDDPKSISTGYTVEKLTTHKHPWPVSKNGFNKRHARLYGSRNVGGPFSVQKRTAFVLPARVSLATTNPAHVSSWWEYSGYLWHESTPSGLPNMTDVPGLIFANTMSAKGTIGWNKFKPTHTQVSLGQTLGELRALGGLPINPKMIKEIREIGRIIKAPIRTFRHALRNHDPAYLTKYAGSGYLGYEFGVKPYVQDIMDLTKSVLQFDKNLRQLVRDNGRAVRRKGRVSLDTQRIVTDGLGGIAGRRFRPILATQLWSGSTQASLTEVTTLEFWFSGRFTYWLQPHRQGVLGIPAREKYQLQRILYGADPTDVTLIWNLMPWSWLIDWLVPIGPMIDNLVNDQTDRLTADYAYIMGHSTNARSYVVRGQLDNAPPMSASVDLIDETKQRARASPYGFGVSFTGLSLRQLAILAALGVTRDV